MEQADPAGQAGERQPPTKYRVFWTALVVLLSALLLWHLNRWGHGLENSYFFLAYAALLLVNTRWFTSRWKTLILGLGALVLVVNDIRLLF